MQRSHHHDHPLAPPPYCIDLAGAVFRNATNTSDFFERVANAFVNWFGNHLGACGFVPAIDRQSCGFGDNEVIKAIDQHMTRAILEILPYLDAPAVYRTSPHWLLMRRRK